ncbi:MAG: hypothetical protein COW08_05870 [Ignavibacteriales bacterium CG12_big_fil_rev_8_21_14_0_65_30_8]|nr:MAG: hypothetical protein COW08_05870 [Ignavibacteriales bacterium CG12_big_fil_rev_8_21_14_0_65_30_8]
MSKSDKNVNLSNPQKSDFENLVKMNMKKAYYIALGFLGSHDLAMDASQEAFIKAYKNFNKFDKSKNFFTWYYKILKNHCLNIIRNIKNKKEDNYIEIKNISENPLDNIEQKEQIKLLEDALEKLSFEKREIIILKEFEEKSYLEITELLNIPLGSVMSRLFYARKELGKILLKEMI